MPALSLLSAHRPASVRRCLVWLAAVGWTLGVQAAVVQPTVDLLQPGGTMPAPSNSALERALTVDTNTSQRNLELLLDARRAGDAAGQAPLRSGASPDNRRALPVAEPRSGVVPLGLQGQDSVTAPGASERREWQTGATSGRQGGAPGYAGGATGSSGDAGLPGPADRGAGAAESGEAAQLVAEAVQFLREHRFWLLGGLGLVALVAASLQSYTRRR